MQFLQDDKKSMIFDLKAKDLGEQYIEVYLGDSKVELAVSTARQEVTVSSALCRTCFTPTEYFRHADQNQAEVVEDNYKIESFYQYKV